MTLVFFGSPEDTTWRQSIGLPPYDGHTTAEWVQRYRALSACWLAMFVYHAWCLA